MTKKKIILFSLIFIIFSFSLGMGLSYVISHNIKSQKIIQTLTKKTSPKKIEKKKIITYPLFVLDRTDAQINNISLADLKILYCGNQIYFLENLKAYLDKSFTCSEGQTPTLVTTSDNISNILKQNQKIIVDFSNISPLGKMLNIDNINYLKDSDNYKFTISEEEGKLNFLNPKKPDITKISMTGVTAISRYTGAAADKYGTAFLTEKVRGEFTDSDFIHISNEVSITPNCAYMPSKGTRFCSKERDYAAFKDIKVNIVELTGNHNKDYGQQYFINTFSWYQNNNIKTFGGGLSPNAANTPLIIETKDKKKIAFIGFNESCPLGECADKEGLAGANRYNYDKAKLAIENIKNNKLADFIICSVQFNEVDSYLPLPTQKKITEDLINLGADLVYGSQAHQIQQVKYFNGKIIYYGFGNFLFDQVYKEGLRQGMIVHNYFYNGRLIQSEPAFTYISSDRRPVMATPDQIVAIKKNIYSSALLY
jgi:poly-gamma-glutamate capsule biosynthesis protein CapA/YwtB (metallophosphatase superfamily)